MFSKTQTLFLFAHIGNLSVLLASPRWVPVLLLLVMAALGPSFKGVVDQTAWAWLYSVPGPPGGFKEERVPRGAL